MQSVMKNTGASAQEALDLVAAGFQRGLNKSGDFLDTLTEYGPQFGKAKMSAGELFSLLETGLGTGVLGTDKISDAFKEFGFSIADTSQGMVQAFAQIGIKQEDLQAKINAGQLTQTQAFQLVMDKVRGVASETDHMAVISQIFKGAGEDLGNLITKVDTGKTKIGDLAGSTEQVKGSFNSLGRVFTTTWREVQLALEPTPRVTPCQP